MSWWLFNFVSFLANWRGLTVLYPKVLQENPHFFQHSQYLGSVEEHWKNEKILVGLSRNKGLQSSPIFKKIAEIKQPPWQLWSLIFRERPARIFFIFGYSLLHTLNIENIEKYSGFPEELLIKERDLLLVVLTKFTGSSPK